MKESTIITPFVRSENEGYAIHFHEREEKTNGDEPHWLCRIRKDAFLRFSQLGFPTTKNEEWKYTNVIPLSKISFRPALQEVNDSNFDSIRKLMRAFSDCYQLVFINGYYQAELSSPLLSPSGIIISNLASQLTNHSELIEQYFARYAQYKEHVFVALNTSSMTDGAYVYLPRKSVIEKPIHLLFFSSVPAYPTVTHPRNLIIVEEGVHAQIIESYIGSNEGVYFTNAVTEIIAEPHSHLEHCKLQKESQEAFHIATLDVYQNFESIFSSHSISLGGSLVRNDVRAVLDAPQSECTLNGLYMTRGQQHVDNHTRIDHKKPHCISHELYKGVLDGKSTGVFNGKIYVWPDAQKTDAKQTNKNLLLSDEASMNTKPQLEIYADDVKCTHGATIGQLDENAIFYLRSRGIDKETASKILTRAFANDIIKRIGIKKAESYLEQTLFE